MKAAGALVAAIALGLSPHIARAADPMPATDVDEAALRAVDARFWQAYNACDVDTMASLVTDDIEFYHDKGGLTTTRAALAKSLRDGLCGNPDARTRREIVTGRDGFHPLAGGYAILSGDHLFHFREGDAPERLVGRAGFTNLWKRGDDGQWRMHRVLSFDHREATAADANADAH